MIKPLDHVMKNKNVAVWGWWQGRNLGDMWILESIKKRFPNIIPIDTNIEEYTKYDFLIIGGGGLLNGPSLRAPFDKPLGTKYGAFGLGGEFHITDIENLSNLINNSCFFGVRDKYNTETYNINNLNNKLKVSGDCTFLYPLKNLKPNKMIKNIKLIWRDPHGLLKWDKSKHHQEDGVILNSLFAKYMCNIPHNDNPKCLELYTNILKKYGNVLYDNYSVTNFKINDINTKFTNIDLVVTMRYHGVIAAIQLGIPCIALDIYPKVRTVMTDAGLSKYCIKLKEYQSIHGLIQDIKTNWDDIISKMNVYKKNQTKIVNDFANIIESIIIKELI